MQTRTKIICTIGPSCNTLDKMLELIEAGMNVARVNFSHGTYEEHIRTFEFLKTARLKTGRPLAIMLDTRGPEVRIRTLKDHQVYLTKGDTWLLVKEDIEGDAERVSINPSHVLNDLQVGAKILFDDGYIETEVVEKHNDSVRVEIKNSGVMKSRKGVNIPNVELNLPALTEQDIHDIKFGCSQQVDMIAASFIRTAENVLAIKNLLKSEGRPNTMIISKIENSEGVQNFDSILHVSDGIMIARGDLGVEMPISQIPRLQKMMIRKCSMAGKPAVTATQMLESMMQNPLPTRAEVSDVANAIYDSSSAVMLSGETAAGKYPIETVKVMTDIIIAAEADFDYQTFFGMHAPLVYNDVPSSVTLATVKTAYSSNAKAIFCFTSKGATVDLLARLRPKIPIVAMTSSEECYHQMALNWGTIPFLSDYCDNAKHAVERIGEFALERGIVSNGDLVVVTAGTPFGVAGTTNTMMVENIGNVLVRGQFGWGRRVHGNVTVLMSAETKKPYEVRDQIIVIPTCDDSFLPHIYESIGIILQNHIDDHDSETHALEAAEDWDLPLIIRADGASEMLKDGQLISLDPDKGLVYKGVVF